MSDINSLLDAQLDDLADLPEFGVYPAGMHRVSISFETKKVNEKSCVEAKMKLLETVEQANPADAPASVGQEGSVLYMLDNEFGQGNLKKVLTPIAQSLGLSRLGDVIEQAKGMEVTVLTKIRQNKDKTQSYCDIVKVIV